MTAGVQFYVACPKDFITGQGAEKVRKVFLARGGMLVFQIIRHGPVVNRDQDQIVLSGIVEPEGIGQLWTGREMQKTVGLIVGRAIIEIACGFPFCARYNFEYQSHIVATQTVSYGCRV